MTDVMWHFASTTLRDGSPLPRAGEISETIEDIEPCVRGWHASRRVLDALPYAPGNWLAQVTLHGMTMEHGNPPDKVVGQRRCNVTDYVDVEDVLREFARQCACDVSHLWEPPQIVVDYLRTGNEEIRDAAGAAVPSYAICTAWVARVALVLAGPRAAAWAAAEDAQNERLESMLIKAMQ